MKIELLIKKLLKGKNQKRTPLISVYNEDGTISPGRITRIKNNDYAPEIFIRVNRDLTSN